MASRLESWLSAAVAFEGLKFMTDHPPSQRLVEADADPAGAADTVAITEMAKTQ